MYYLREWRLEDAEKTFKVLEDAEKSKLSYRPLGVLGKAMVMAFRGNQPQKSNDLFVTVLVAKPKFKKEVLTYSPQLQKRPELAEMVAKALNHNMLNAPEAFPQSLRVYLAPPPAKTKGSDESIGGEPRG
jgi:hypothetical protein